jgi:hypothetical protein
MDSPVLQVKKSCKKDYKLVCMKTCDKYKKSDYCQMEKEHVGSILLQALQERLQMLPDRGDRVAWLAGRGGGAALPGAMGL